MKKSGQKVVCPECGKVIVSNKQVFERCPHLLSTFVTDEDWFMGNGSIRRAVLKRAAEQANLQSGDEPSSEEIFDAYKDLYDRRPGMTLVMHDAGYIGGCCEIQELFLFSTKGVKVMTEKERSDAAKKAWKTMRAREDEMSPRQLRALRLKRSQAAYKAWETIRSKRAA